jgi:hypothetical protein
MNTTFEIGMTVAMLALWALAVVATSESRTPPPMRPMAQQVAVVASPALAASAPLVATR